MRKAKRRSDGAVFKKGDFVITSMCGVRMAGTIYKIKKDGIVKFYNVYQDGNNVTRRLTDIDHFDKTKQDVFVWLKS